MDNRDQIEEIKSKLDISSVIQQYVPSLKRSGRNYFGLCPFHHEKTPSFSVNPELGLFKCFGCGEGGDVIKFLEKIESLDFPNALELAANKAGVTLKKISNPRDQKFKEEKDQLLAVNKLTAQFYHYILLEHKSGEPGRAYTLKRQIPEAQLKDFLIGYAPRSYNNLRSFLNKKGFKDLDLVKWGLLVEKNGKIYDKFRDRVMFPVLNHQGEVVGFSGRMITDADLGPKYLNSPETLVYKKSHLLFGLYQAKDAIRDKGWVILVEGNIDLMSSHKAGVKNIVAPLGTALTEEQLRLIKRYCEQIYFAFDTDAAGQKALLRSFALTEKVSLESYVIDIKSYKDVDDLIIAGVDWAAVVSKPKETVAYLIDSLAQKYDLDNTKFKARYVAEVLQYIKQVQDKIAVADYLHKISQKTGIKEETLALQLEQYQSPTTTTQSEPIEQNLPLQRRKMTLDQLMVEFIALLINNKDYPTEAKFISKVLGSGPAFMIYQELMSGQKNPELEKYAKIMTEIKMRPLEEISDPRIFASILANLGHRIIFAKAQKEINKLKQQIHAEDDAINKIYEAAKLLKN